MQRITANFHTLLGQASSTAHDYLIEGQDRIDKMFGQGYAKKNPILLAGFMQAAATDLTASITAQQITDAIDHLVTAIHGLGSLEHITADIESELNGIKEAIWETDR